MLSLPLTGIDPVALAQRLSSLPGFIWLDSSDTHSCHSRYSFMGVDPFTTIVQRGDKTWHGNTLSNQSLMATINTHLTEYACKFDPNLPPFQGGLAGFLGYDCRHELENLPPTAPMEWGDLRAWLGAYDLILAFDHQRHTTTLLSTGAPAKTPTTQSIRAKSRADWLQAQLHTPLPQPNLPVKQATCIQPRVSKTQYLNSIRQAQQYIYQGDIFEVNLAQRFTTQVCDSPLQLYLSLRQRNPAPFAGFLNCGAVQIASSSPERFLRVQGRHIEACPIKGTIKRDLDPSVDQHLAATLLASTKDRAENIMIVDLMRNDLSKLCLPTSVKVNQLCQLESYQSVHHLVSTISGQLHPDRTLMDCLRATFPAGSITGAPKVRAMEIIHELEAISRGPYCGNLGYFGYAGNMDTSVLIRSLFLSTKQVSFYSGGAITLDSDPVAEYEETCLKAEKLTAVWDL